MFGSTLSFISAWNSNKLAFAMPLAFNSGSALRRGMYSEEISWGYDEVVLALMVNFL
tara:strand:- start:48 stop:218 length:171 start_codon:yes stop_codon:yes gene_type:complete